jgi:DNA-binding MarR family transcriptional regulator
VLSEAQARLLRWLGGFPTSLDEAWDVPRGLSLPGIAEGLGVVRSAVHAPMEALVEQGLVKTRDAHVVGGGSRRRRVHHLTPEGRERFIALEDGTGQPRDRSSRWSGPRAPPARCVGREDDLEALLHHVNGASPVVLTGLAGIGKTTLASLFAERHLDAGGHVHWCTCGTYDALADLLGALSPSGGFASDEAAAAHLAHLGPKHLVVIDGLEHLHPSHAPGVWAALPGDLAARVLLVGRAPVEAPTSVQRQRLGPLSVDAACALLDRDLEDDAARRIAERLEGHPLALLLHPPDLDVSEAPEDVTRFVLEAVLDGLDDDERASMNELSVLPMPVPAGSLRTHAIGDLDERALLRWSLENAVRLHALVHLVHREGLPQDQVELTAALGVEHWGRSTDPLAPLMHLHHRLLAGGEGLANAAEAMLRQSEGGGLGRLAAILDDALERGTEAERLHGVAAEVAVRRGRSEQARKHLDAMDVPDPVVNANVLRLEGRLEEADAALHACLEAEHDLRARIALVTAHIEDRLPEDVVSDEAFRLLDDVRPGSLPEEQRATAVAAMAALRCTLLVLAGRCNEATELVADLDASTVLHPALLADLRWRIALRAEPLSERLVGGLAQHLEGRDDLRALALRMTLVERLVVEDPIRAAALLAELRPSEDATLAGRRLLARWATCSARLDTSAGSAAGRLQAAALHRHAGSLRAAARLIEEHGRRG